MVWSEDEEKVCIPFSLWRLEEESALNSSEDKTELLFSNLPFGQRWLKGSDVTSFSK